MSETVPAAPTYADIALAAERIEPFVHRTRVVSNWSLNERVGCEVFLKCEHEQRTGSFKIRGAINNLLQLSEVERARGVVAHSSGNHAQAVALAAKVLGMHATIVMPHNANAIKKAATEGYGARVVSCADTDGARVETADRIVAETGGTLIHPNASPRTIAGAGTAALELLEDVPSLDALIAPVGGGGLSCGAALACAGWTDAPVFVGAEPAGADDAARSMETGVHVVEQTPSTIADGLRTCLGPLNFQILSEHGVRVVTVSEAEIVDAMRFVWQRAKLPIEPSSAVAVAALLGDKWDLDARRIGVILSGGNVDTSAYFDGLLA